ncbi:DedA family protein [bacterium]|nr:DedA family protein [bacterium]
MESNIENIIIASGYIGIFALMIANGLLSFPSSQALYIIAGYFVFTEDLSLALVSLFGALGNTVGNIALYEIVRAKGLSYITKFQIFPLEAVKRTQAVFQKRGAWFVFFGKLIPALKVFVPIPAGIARMNRLLYGVVIFVSSVLWSLLFIAIGFYFGKSADVFGKYALILFVVAFVVVFAFYRSMNSQNITDEIKKG